MTTATNIYSKTRYDALASVVVCFSSRLRIRPKITFENDNDHTTLDFWQTDTGTTINDTRRRKGKRNNWCIFEFKFPFSLAVFYRHTRKVVRSDHRDR